MQIKRQCKVCGKEFLAIKTTQFFCCRKCFKRSYYLTTKEKIIKQEQNPSYPIKRCSFCEATSQLNFDPLENPDLFDNWQCPKCGTTNKLIWKYNDNRNSHQIISSILVTFQISATYNKIPQYQVYKLPINNLEENNSSIVVMACEMADILDIRKNNRKRILFS
jgi:hypothetical protein